MIGRGRLRCSVLRGVDVVICRMMLLSHGILSILFRVRVLIRRGLGVLRFRNWSRRMFVRRLFGRLSRRSVVMRILVDGRLLLVFKAGRRTRVVLLICVCCGCRLLVIEFLSELM